MKYSRELMYQALLNKDASFEGQFWVAVKTTHIFCRPSCTAKKPKQENVEFFENTRDAMIRGYRPCKVCRPLELFDSTPEWVKKLLKKVESQPDQKIRDDELRQMGIEPNTLRRWFQKNHQMTFHAYQRMLRVSKAYEQLQKEQSVTETALEIGYQSLSAFNTSFQQLVGKKPSEVKKAAHPILFTRFDTPLGPMFAAAVREGLCLLEFTDRKMLETEIKALVRQLKAPVLFGENEHLQQTKKQMEEYFAGKRKEFDLLLHTPGTEFQKKVWQGLIEIPYGDTTTYIRLAATIDKAKAIRAVGTANGMNRVSIVVPCHRVIGENGDLTGYGGGIWRKKWLLEFEKNHRNA